MKLLIFTNEKETLDPSTANIIKEINSGNPLNFVSKELRDKLPENIYSLIQNIEVETFNTNSVFSINRHKINKFPTLIFMNEQTEVYRWGGSIPKIEELVSSIKNYMSILQTSIPDVDWDIDE